MNPPFSGGFRVSDIYLQAFFLFLKRRKITCRTAAQLPSRSVDDDLKRV